MKLINLTPHNINVATPDGVATITASGEIARCSTNKTLVGNIAYEGFEIPEYQTVLGDLEGLPAPQPGTLYIVSRVVLSAAAGRTDLRCPGELLRDNAGRVIGCEGLSK